MQAQSKVKEAPRPEAVVLRTSHASRNVAGCFGRKFKKLATRPGSVVMSLIPDLGSQPCLCSEFQASYGYIVRPCLKKSKRKETGQCLLGYPGNSTMCFRFGVKFLSYKDIENEANQEAATHSKERKKKLRHKEKFLIKCITEQS